MSQSPAPKSPRSSYHVMGTSLLILITLAATTLYVLDAKSDLARSIILDSAKEYTDTLRALRHHYTSEVVDRVHGKVEVRQHYRDTEGSIPLPMTLSMGFAEKLYGKRNVFALQDISIQPGRSPGPGRDVFH